MSTKRRAKALLFIFSLLYPESVIDRECDWFDHNSCIITSCFKYCKAIARYPFDNLFAIRA